MDQKKALDRDSEVRSPRWEAIANRRRPRVAKNSAEAALENLAEIWQGSLASSLLPIFVWVGVDAPLQLGTAACTHRHVRLRILRRPQLPLCALNPG